MARFGMNGKLTARQGHREQLIQVLMEAADLLRDADGCELYVIQRDLDDAQVVWVTEVWRSQAQQEGSLELPGVRPVIDRAVPMIEKAEANRLAPIGGVGIS